MPVVTIRGPLGSGAPEIGREVANRIHVDYVDRQIIAEVAARLRRQEQDVVKKEMPPGTLLGRIAQALEHSYDFEGVGLPSWEIPVDDTRYLQSLESVIKELAVSKSLVIFGRGSQFILRDYPGALHVSVIAPQSVRAKRVMQNQKLSEEAAKQQVAHHDSSSRQFIKRYFHADPEASEHYDLVINTEHLSFDTAASIIISALSFKDQATGKQSRTS